MLKLTMYGMMVGAAGAPLTSCVQKTEQQASTPSIQHSSPDVLSLQDYQNEKNLNNRKSGGFLSVLLDILLGSNPDSDLDDLFDEQRESRERKDKSKFLRDNRAETRRDLESQKD